MSRLALLMMLAPAIHATKDLETLFSDAEAVALNMASEVERLYQNRCATYSSCANSHYDNFESEYPSQTCPAAGFLDPKCAACTGGGAEAGPRLFDYTVSAVRLPESVSTSNDNEPTLEAAETVCYTKELDTFFKATHQANIDSEAYGDYAPQQYYGAATGAFRIFPARHSSSQGSYDPRKRPWYVASSSGPKDVILVLDASGSMQSSGRASLMIDAAKQVVSSLTIADFFSVVLFSSQASYLQGNGQLQPATKANKDAAKDALEAIGIGGSTNFQDGFAKAFDALDRSVPLEHTSACHRVILFLTDGAMTEGTVDDVLRLIANRNAAYGAFVFAYTLGSGAEKSIPKRIACSNSGLYDHIDDGGDLAAEMSGYYQLLARGLGDQVNEGFTAWVEPYSFATGGVMGTTVGAPVYDRSVSPPHFIGVAATDMTLEYLEQQSGDGYERVLERLVARSRAQCPTLDLSTCVLQALRLSTGGAESVCPANEGGGCMTADGGVNTINGTYEPISCSRPPPQNVWVNTNLRGMSYEERVCCVPNASEAGIAQPSCLPNHTWVVVFVVVSGGLGLCLLLLSFRSFCKFMRERKANARTAANPTSIRVAGSTVTGVPMGRPVS